MMVGRPKKLKSGDIETEPDAWDRFKRTMDKIVPPKRKPNEGESSKPSKREKGTGKRRSPTR